MLKENKDNENILPRYCKECGNEINPQFLFCKICDTEMTIANSNLTNKIVSAEKKRVQNNDKKIFGLKVNNLSIILLSISLLMAAISIRKIGAFFGYSILWIILILIFKAITLLFIPRDTSDRQERALNISLSLYITFYMILFAMFHLIIKP